MCIVPYASNCTTHRFFLLLFLHAIISIFKITYIFVLIPMYQYHQFVILFLAILEWQLWNNANLKDDSNHGILYSIQKHINIDDFWKNLQTTFVVCINFLLKDSKLVFDRYLTLQPTPILFLLAFYKHKRH